MRPPIRSAATRTAPTHSSSAAWAPYARRVLYSRLSAGVQIEESARLCLYLASDATFTTGAEHLITGGAELAYGDKNQRKKVTGGGIPPCE